ncbi:hypothetical protein V8C34DRAFT_306352 [Trichoderma compactum]
MDLPPQDPRSTWIGGGTAPTCAVALPEGNSTLLNPVFWPADLLPKECPNSRILMFGYDSKVTKYTAGSKEILIALWLKYNFQVKTFQEGLSLAKLGKKVVPDYTSLIGDYREDAETLQANHIEMCRYSGPDDPNYRKVAGELHSRCRFIAKSIAIQAPPSRRRRLNKSAPSTTSSEEASQTLSHVQANEACLGSLWFPSIHTRYQSLQRPADDTCSWLFDHELYQLLAKDKQYLRYFQKMHDTVNIRRGDMEPRMVVWPELDLMVFFEMMLVNQKKKQMIIFIDALDECEESNVRTMAYFWWRITKSAYDLGIDLNVCLSSRHFPTITLDDCAEIIVERHNSDDIATYVDQKLQVCMTSERLQWNLLREHILNKSDGMFLWVVLVVEDVLKDWDDGKDMPHLIKLVTDWAILATKPLHLHEWHHIMAFIRQLEKQIRGISRGLVEVQRIGAVDSKHDGSVVASIHAKAGSLDLEYGDTRIVRVIHESVRDFFLTSNGFGMLDSSQLFNPIGNGHLSIMATCLDYLNIAELDALVEARLSATPHKDTRIHSQIEHQDSLAADSLPHDKGHVNNRHGTSDEKNWAPQDEQFSARRDKASSVFERLKSLDYTPIHIAEWMSKDDCFSAQGTCPGEIRCKSITYSSEMSQSRLLEDYPAVQYTGGGPSLRQAFDEFHSRPPEEQHHHGPRSVASFESAGTA